MYVGILVDTNRFKTRTGGRTFEAAAYLKNLGVDPIMAENLLKENFDEFEEKTSIMKYARKYKDNMIIAAVDNHKAMNRTLMSQVADSLLNIKNVEASFVIGNIEDGRVAVSARSKGIINVQVIMENMHGGGHFTMAALQRENSSVQAINEELMQVIDAYLNEKEEDDKDESNSTK